MKTQLQEAAESLFDMIKYKISNSENFEGFTEVIANYGDISEFEISAWVHIEWNLETIESITIKQLGLMNAIGFDVLNTTYSEAELESVLYPRLLKYYQTC